MTFLVKLIITEAVGVVVGLTMAAGSEVESKVGVVGSVLCIISAIALVVCGLWYVWSL